MSLGNNIEMAKEQAKREIKQAIWKKIPIHIRIIIIAVVVVVFIMFFGIMGAVAGGSSSSLETTSGTMPANGDYVVKTDAENAAPVIKDIDKLKTAFSGYPTNSKLIANAEVFLEMQETYKVNAIFAAAVSIQETTAGTNGSYATEGHNWFNYMPITGIRELDGYLGTMGNWCKWDSDEHGIMGFGYYISQHSSCYFSQGEYTVSTIGSHYCVPPEGWISGVQGFMTKLYEAAGITQSSLQQNSDFVISGNSNFLDVAKQCHDYLANNNYYYSSSANIAAGRFVRDSTSIGSSIPKPYPGEGNYIDCSAYVTWALYEYGYTEFKGHQKVAYQFKDMAYSGYNGWKVIPIEQIQPGDLVWKPGHIEIYAGNNNILSCGSTESIRAKPFYNYTSRDSYISYRKGQGGIGIKITPPPIIN